MKTKSRYFLIKVDDPSKCWLIKDQEIDYHIMLLDEGYGKSIELTEGEVKAIVNTPSTKQIDWDRFDTAQKKLEMVLK